MIADHSWETAAVRGAVRPEPKPDLWNNVTAADVMEAAREFYRSGFARSMREALSWAWHCHREWKAAKEAQESAERADYFTRFHQRRNAGKVYQCTEHEGNALAGGNIVEFYDPEIEARLRDLRAS